jgi:hypothetical protein
LRVVISPIDSTKRHQEIKKGKVSVEAIDEKRNGEQIRVGRGNKRNHREKISSQYIKHNRERPTIKEYKIRLWLKLTLRE